MLRMLGATAVVTAIAACTPGGERGMAFLTQVCRSAPPAGAGAFRRDMDIGMARMMKDMHAPGYSGHADADFLAMMIPHHAGAVEMARLALLHGHDPATRRLAEEIIAGQTNEIEGMTRRLAALRDPGGAASGSVSLGGTRGP